MKEADTMLDSFIAQGYSRPDTSAPEERAAGRHGEHSLHPIRAYLDSLKWDGIKRIDDWLTLYLGVDPSDYARDVGAKFLIGGIARVYRPGVKHDTCLILEGPQGALKSTALRTLAGADFFADDIAELGSKDSVMQTIGVWIVELIELDAMTRRELSRIKAFMSRQVDRIRLPYGRRVVELPRECIFAGTVNAGTVNKDTYLNDETGSRRFWPIRCGAVKIPDLTRDRDQLWAEARDRFRAGDTWWLDNPLLMESAAEETQARYLDDPWDEIIAAWLNDPQQLRDPGYTVPALASTGESVTVTDILIHCIGKRPDTWLPADQMRVARCLKANGWKRYAKQIPGRREWRYSKLNSA
jgi:predicted P-loop ATPase